MPAFGCGLVVAGCDSGSAPVEGGTAGGMPVVVVVVTVVFGGGAAAL